MLTPFQLTKGLRNPLSGQFQLIDNKLVVWTIPINRHEINCRDNSNYQLITTRRVVMSFFFFAFPWKFHELQHFVSRFAVFFPPPEGTIPKKIIRELQTKARQSKTWGRRTVWAVCAAYRHSPLYGTDQGHPQPHSQAMAGCRKRRESRELPLSSRQSRLTDVGETNTKSPAIFFVVDGFVARKVVYSYAREARSPL